MEPQCFPTTTRYRNHRPLSGREVHAKRDFLGASVWMKDEVVHWAALNQDVRVVWRKPMEIVDGTVAREHVVILALHCQSATVHGHRLFGSTDDPEVSRLFGQDIELQHLDQFTGASLRRFSMCGKERDQPCDSDYRSQEIISCRQE